MNYRYYKNFTEQAFKQDLREELQSIQVEDLDYNNFQNCFEKVLEKHGPMKKKYARANDGPFMNRALRKATILRPRLKNRYDKSPTVENWEAFREQRNLCVKLFRTEKRNFYKRLNVSDITDNKKFWKQLSLSSRIKGSQIQKLPLLKMKRLFRMTKKLQRL